MSSVQAFLAAVSIVLILAVLVQVRRAHIRVEYSVSWLGAGVALLFVAAYPGLLPAVASLLHFEDQALALILLVGCIFLFVLLRVSIVLSALKDNNIALAQRVAILEYRLAHHYHEQETND